MDINNSEYELLPFVRNSLAGVSLYTDIKCGLTNVCGLTTELSEDGSVLNIFYDNTWRSCVLSVKDGQAVCEDGESACVLVYSGGGVKAPRGVKKAENVSEVGDCLELCIGANDDEIYRIFSRSRKGYASVYYIGDGCGGIAATGSIVAKNRKYAVIGDIYTAESCRGKGLAAEILYACVADALGEGLIPALYCKPEMKNYYLQKGFSETENG